MTNVDSIVFTFNSVHPKWSFVKLNARGCVVEVAEKNPISNIATCGIYWYRKGSDFVKYAQQMISKNIRVNNEFYVDSLCGELIKLGLQVYVFEVDFYVCWGTPNDLRTFNYWQSFFHKCTWHPYSIELEVADSNVYAC